MTHEVTCPEKPAPPPPPLQTPTVVEDSVKARPSNDLKMAEAHTSKGCTNGLKSGRSNSTEAVSGCTEVCKGDLPVHYQYGNTSSADELKRIADEVIVPEGSCPEKPLSPPQPPHTAAADAALSEVIDCKISPRNGQECKVSTHIPDDNTHIKTCVKGERETSRDGGGEGKEEKVVYAAEEHTTPLFSRKVRPRCENSPKVNEMQEMNDCGAGVGVGRCTLGGCERLDASWSRRVIVAKGTKRCKEALCLIKGALICTANFTFTVKDADGEALRRTHELLAQVPEGLVLERAEVKHAIAHYHTWCGKHPNYNKTDELLQEVGRELEHERRKAWPTDVPKAGADMVRWVSATRMLVICLLDQANLCRSRAYDEHGNFEKIGGLSRLEQAVELFRAGELVYNEPSYRPYRNTSHGINLIRVWDVAKSAAASLKAAKEQHHQGLVPEPACFSQAASKRSTASA